MFEPSPLPASVPHTAVLNPDPDTSPIARSPVKTVTGSLSDGDEEAWECFEALVAKKKTITVEDIPFPKGLHSDEVWAKVRARLGRGEWIFLVRWSGLFVVCC